MKCVVCGERKGKRACPAKDAVICAQCCGEKRVLEIACPQTCDYLKTGRERDTRKQWAAVDPEKLSKYRRVVGENRDFLATIEYTIASERLSTRDLKDKHVAEALDLLLRTLRSEDSGVLYEQTSDDILVEGLRRQLLHVVQEARRPAETPADRYAISPAGPSHLKLRAAIEALEFIRELVRNHMNNTRSLPGYADNLARTILVDVGPEETAPSIIIPGR